MSARDDILASARAALAGADRTSPHVPRSYRHQPRPATQEALLDLFAERVADYRADVRRVTADQVEAAIGSILGDRSVIVAPELPWPVAGAVLDSGQSAAELDRLDAVVTAARVGIAETGTIVLDHTGDQGRRALSLVPDLHVCVIRADQIVPGVPDAVALLDPSRPQTWISGPSATSDIELSRVEGVHGPRHLHVLLVAGETG